VLGGLPVQPGGSLGELGDANAMSGWVNVMVYMRELIITLYEMCWMLSMSSYVWTSWVPTSMGVVMGIALSRRNHVVRVLIYALCDRVMVHDTWSLLISTPKSQ